MSTQNDCIKQPAVKKNRWNLISRFGFGNIRNFLILIALTLCFNVTYAQIYEPEGLNLPGLWNGWTNPPSNNLALASYTQVPGGRVTKITSTNIRWQTIFSVAATGADLVGGTYPWLFTSGPSGNPWANKWAGVTVVKNTLQSYTYNTGTDNSITISNGKWYTMNWNDNGYANSQAIFMETTNQPVVLNSVSIPSNVYENTPVTINLTVSASPSAEEIFYLRYTTDLWTTSGLLTFTMTGPNGTVNIPGQSAGTRVDYYAFSSTVSSITSNYDLFTIRTNNNSGTNYHYNVGSTPFIAFANLNGPETGNIQPGNDFDVSALVYVENITDADGQGSGIQAWIGYSTTNTNPSTWTNWVLASYDSDDDDNDEYIANIGTLINTEGTYYYASRFKYLNQAYVYGGYSGTGGGFWNGTTNISGILTVSNIPPPDPVIGFANLQWPGSGAIELGTDYQVYAQAWIEDITNQAGQTADLQAWIGYSTTDSDPSTWTNWLPATFNTDAGNNDEFMSNLGAAIVAEGTYYYASRFQYLAQEYVYGGFSSGGGGFWDGTTNESGVLTVTLTPPPDPEISFANLQWPGTGEIEPGNDFNVYAQAYIENVTNQAGQATGLQSWIGYSSTNSDPSTWTNWLPATFNSDAGSNDEFMANLGAAMVTEGTFYYASRFQYLAQDYVYGGFSATGGGFWDGTNNINGVLTVAIPPPPEIGFASLHWPGSGTIEPGSNFTVFAQAWIEDITNQAGQTSGLQSWIGYSSSNTNPSGWTNWIPATYNTDDGNNDEFLANLGAAMTTVGTYYYATRFQYLAQDYVYGGFSESGGGFWDGTENISGVLTVTNTPPEPEITFANLQWPPTATIITGMPTDIYGQVLATAVNLDQNGYEGLQVWIGYSDQNTNPETWTNWYSAVYDGISEYTERPEYRGQIGEDILVTGTCYYAVRYQLNSDAYLFGGYSEAEGGFWDGTNNISGVLTVVLPPEPEIGYASIESPGSGAIQTGDAFTVNSLAWIEGLTGQGPQTAGLQAWIGYSNENTDPSTWTEWIAADFTGPNSGNDAFSAEIGSSIPTEGTWYYAARFQYLEQDFVYGGYSATGGGFWDGTNNVSGILMVEDILVLYPVLFTVTDATETYTNLKFKGDMTNWVPVSLDQIGNIWTTTLDLVPGTYQWGVIEDDGSPGGIWLLENDTLQLTIDADGMIVGDTSVVITWVGQQELSAQTSVFPNPSLNTIKIKWQDAISETQIYIMSAQGELIQTHQTNDNNLLIDLSSVPAGTYFILLRQGNNQWIKTIIRQ